MNLSAVLRVALSWILLCALLQAQQPAKKQHERMLSAAEQEQVNAWEKAIAKLEMEEKEKSAVIELAAKILELRKRVQGVNHWEVRDEELRLAHLRRTFTPEEQATLDEAATMESQAAGLYSQHKYAQVEPIAQRVLEMRRSVLGADHPNSVQSLRRLAGVLYRQGKYTAVEPIYEEAIRLGKTTFGLEHPATESMLNQLGLLHYQLGRYSKAEEVFKESLRITSETIGEKHWSHATRLNNLALVYTDQAKYASALPLYQQAINVYRESSGEDADLALFLNNLARLYGYQGKYKEAEARYKESIAMFRQVGGAQHPDLALALNNLGYLYDLQARDKLAEQSYKQALNIYRALFGDVHPRVGMCLSNLGRLYGEQGKFGLAEPMQKRALEIYRRVYGERHPETAACLSYLGELYASQQRYAEAAPLQQMATGIHRSTLGDHPITAASINGLGLLYSAMGTHEKAEKLHRQALVMRRSIHGTDEHKDIGQSHHNLALVYRQMDRLQEAETHEREALRIYRATLSDDSLTVALSSRTLASVLGQLGQYPEANELSSRAVEVYRRLQPGGPELAKALTTQAQLYVKQSRYSDAGACYRECLEIAEQTYGPTHPLTVTGRTNLGIFQWNHGDKAAAIKSFRQSAPLYDGARLRLAASGFERDLVSSQRANPHILLAAALAMSGEPREAFLEADAFFGRGLLDDLSAHASQDLERRIGLARQLDALDKKLVPLLAPTESNDEQQSMRERLVKERTTLATELDKLTIQSARRGLASLDQIQTHIDEDAALVFWVQYLSSRLGCVLRNSGPPQWVKLPGSGADGAWTELDKIQANEAHLALSSQAYSRELQSTYLDAHSDNPFLLASVRRAFDAGQHSAILKRARQLWILPLEKHLAGVNRLIVIPTGSMSELPVESLTEKYEVVYSPSASTLAGLASTKSNALASKVLVVADPAYQKSEAPEPSSPPHGVLIKAVVPRSTASKIGLLAGDVLLEYNGKVVKGKDDFSTDVQSSRVELKIWRGGQQLAARIPSGKLGILIDARPIADAWKAWRSQDPIDIANARDSQWSPLPGTRLEARAIQDLVPSAELLLGSSASQQSLMKLAQSGELKKFRIIHIAAHGQADANQPRRTAIVLAQDQLPSPIEQQQRIVKGEPPIEGRMDVGMVLDQWEFDADMVVLSACQTGLGKWSRNSGMMGFSQALLQKGARSVVLTRWKVDDGATSLLMRRFYENLLGHEEKPMDRAKALHEAKRWLKRLSKDEATVLLSNLADALPRGDRGQVMKALQAVDGKLQQVGDGGERPYQHPYYWAGFVLIGAPDKST